MKMRPDITKSPLQLEWNKISDSTTNRWPRINHKFCSESSSSTWTSSHLIDCLLYVVPVGQQLLLNGQPAAAVTWWWTGHQKTVGVAQMEVFRLAFKEIYNLDRNLYDPSKLLSFFEPPPFKSPQNEVYVPQPSHWVRLVWSIYQSIRYHDESFEVE